MQHEKSSTWKKCNIEQVQHGMSATATWNECTRVITWKQSKTKIGAAWKERNMKKVQHGKSDTKWVQHEKSATQKIMQNEKGPTQKKSIRKVCNTKKCNLKRVRYEKVQNGRITTRNECKTKKVQHEVSATWSKTKQGATWKNHNMKKVQHFKRFNMKRVQDQKSATRKECNTKNCNIAKV